MKEWLQLLQEELKKYDDADLRFWPALWWRELQREGMNPLQAILYTKRTISGYSSQNSNCKNVATPYSVY